MCFLREQGLKPSLTSISESQSVFLALLLSFCSDMLTFRWTFDPPERSPRTRRGFDDGGALLGPFRPFEGCDHRGGLHSGEAETPKDGELLGEVEEVGHGVDLWHLDKT